MPPQEESVTTDKNIDNIKQEELIYSDIELQAMRQTKELLMQEEFCKKFKRLKPFKEREISKRHLAVTTIISKCRAEEAATKYIQWIQTLSYWGITTLNEEQLTDPCKRSDHYLQSYKVAGKDIKGSSIFWIEATEKIPNDLEEEKYSILSGIRYHMAVHSCPITLREGLTFVINVTNQPNQKVGNEKRMQKAHQSYPLRPQHIFIVGASKVARIAINSLLKIGSFVSKAKILKRIKFVTIEEIVDINNGGTVPKESLPKHLQSTCLEDLMANMDLADNSEKKNTKGQQEEIISWVNTRIALIPIPDI